MGVLDKAVTIGEDPGPYVVVVYGESGAGKTVLACGAEKPVLMDCEKGKRSLLNHEELFDIPILKAQTFSQGKNLLNELKKDSDPSIKTVIIDTVSSLQKKDMKVQMKDIAQGRDPDLPSQAEFNKNNRRIVKFIEDCIDMSETTNRNVIFLCHTKEEKNEDGAIAYIRPDTSPGVASAFAPYVDAIFYLVKEADSNGNGKRYLQTFATKRIKGKNRFGSLPPKIEDPHWSVIEKADEAQKEIARRLTITNTITTNETSN